MVRDALAQPAARIKGNFSLAPGGPGMSLASIVAVPSGDPEAEPLSASQSKSLSYTLDSLPAGTYDITISLPGYIPARLTNVVVGAGQTLAAAPVQLQVAASASGTVTSSDPFTPAAFAPLALYQNGIEIAAFQADDQGSFTIGGLEPGSYEIRPAANERYITTAQFTVAAGDQAFGLEVAVHVGAVLTGTLTDSNSGDPLAGQTVHVVDPDGQLLAVRTNAQGEYQFSNLGRGPHRVLLPIVAATNQLPLELTDIDGNLHQLDLQAEVAARISGQLQTAGGQPISGGNVELLAGGLVLATSVTGADGQYEFLLFSTGTFDLRASAPTASFELVSNVVATAGAAVVQNIVAGSATLDVLLTNAGQPLAGVQVYLTQFDGTQVLSVGQATTDDLGVVSFANLEPGNYRLRAIGENNLGILANLTVASGSNQESLALVEQASLSGTIANAEGPVAATIISVVDASGNLVAIGFSRFDGTYVIRNVPTGVYDVVTFAAGHEAHIQTGLVLGGHLAIDVTLLPSQSELIGRVVDSLGNPLAAGSVTLLDAAGHMVGTSTIHTDGTFTIDTAVGAGMTLLVQAEGYDPFELAGVAVLPSSTQNLGDLPLTTSHLGSVTNEPPIQDLNAEQSGQSVAWGLAVPSSVESLATTSTSIVPSSPATIASSTPVLVQQTIADPLADCGCGSKKNKLPVLETPTALTTDGGLLAKLELSEGIDGLSDAEIGTFLADLMSSAGIELSSGGNAWLQSLLELEDLLTSIGTGIDESLVLPLPECSACGAARQKVLDAIKERDAAYREAIRQAAVVALRATSAITTLIRQTVELEIKTAGIYASLGAFQSAPLASALGPLAC